MPSLQQYRSDLDELVRLANLDLAALWRQVSDGAVARDLLQVILPELGSVYGSAAGTLAADWYDDLRAELDIPQRFTARAGVVDLSRTEQSARWAVGPLFSESPDFTLALSNAEGELQKIIADTGRNTITRSSIADPQALGWQRGGSGLDGGSHDHGGGGGRWKRVAGSGCGFCSMLESRGFVYSESSVRFGSHPNCHCSAVPAFDGASLPVHEYQPSARQATDADRARTRQWMAENGYP